MISLAFIYQKINKIKIAFNAPEKFNKDSQNNIISVVGCLENDLGKRLMLTVQPHESIIHLSNYIGQSMQKYRMFQNLLALRATEINVVYQRKKKFKILKN